MKEITGEKLLKEKNTSQLHMEKINQEKVFDVVEKISSYSGVQSAIMFFLASNAQYPFGTQKEVPVTFRQN